MRQSLIASLVFVFVASADGRTEGPVRLRSADERAHLASTIIREAIKGEDFGAKLADYAASPAGDPGRCESFGAAARRILAGGDTTKRTPDETIFTLDDLADRIFADTDAVETNTRATRTMTAGLERELTALRAQAHLARFHARRIVAAMHYNLFLRGQRLSELVAATYAEKDAVAAWRALAALPAAPAIVNARRADLTRLERSLKELEDQCCPPDEAILKEKVWQPRPTTAHR